MTLKICFCVYGKSKDMSKYIERAISFINTNVPVKFESETIYLGDKTPYTKHELIWGGYCAQLGPRNPSPEDRKKIPENCISYVFLWEAKDTRPCAEGRTYFGIQVSGAKGVFTTIPYDIIPTTGCDMSKKPVGDLSAERCSWETNGEWWESRGVGTIVFEIFHGITDGFIKCHYGLSKTEEEHEYGKTVPYIESHFMSYLVPKIKWIEWCYNQLSEEMLTTLSKSMSTDWICPECGMVLPYHDPLIYHLEHFEAPYKDKYPTWAKMLHYCTYCGMTFGNRSDLNMHSTEFDYVHDQQDVIKKLRSENRQLEIPAYWIMPPKNPGFLSIFGSKGVGIYLDKIYKGIIPKNGVLYRTCAPNKSLEIRLVAPQTNRIIFEKIITVGEGEEREIRYQETRMQEPKLFFELALKKCPDGFKTAELPLHCWWRDKKENEPCGKWFIGSDYGHCAPQTLCFCKDINAKRAYIEFTPFPEIGEEYPKPPTLQDGVPLCFFIKLPGEEEGTKVEELPEDLCLEALNKLPCKPQTKFVVFLSEPKGASVTLLRKKKII